MLACREQVDGGGEVGRRVRGERAVVVVAVAACRRCRRHPAAAFGDSFGCCSRRPRARLAGTCCPPAPERHGIARGGLSVCFSSLGVSEREEREEPLFPELKQAKVLSLSGFCVRGSDLDQLEE